MTLLYRDPLFLAHDTGPGHPERAARLAAIDARLDATGLAAACRAPRWSPATPDRWGRVHDGGYVARLAATTGGADAPARRGPTLLPEDADTVVSAASLDAALLAAGAVCDAVERVVRGEDATALCLVRPPGHHALADRAMGFCLLGNVAIAARVALAELELDRVLVVDWDVHHGNGTQDAFWSDGRVGFLSIHRWPFYPGTGAADETGSGRGLGWTVNLPVEFGTPRGEYLARFAGALERLGDRLRPQLVLASAGFDAHRADPIGSLGLEVEDFAALARMVQDVAAVHAGGRMVSALEGGYDTTALALSVEAHLRELLARGGAACGPCPT
jgi:acetoin utilization deacetylase AcuC-like enzyme